MKHRTDPARPTRAHLGLVRDEPSLDLRPDFETWSDEELVEEVLRCRRMRSSDSRAVEELVLRHRGLVLTNCEFMLGPGADAEDSAQDVFIRAYQRVEQLKNGARFRSWVKSIKVNLCLDLLRKRGSRVDVDIDEPAIQASENILQSPPIVVTDAGRRAKIAFVRHVLQSLDEIYRVPLVMSDVDGMSYSEISEALGIGLSATKMRIRRARQAFRERFDNESSSSHASQPES